MFGWLDEERTMNVYLVFVSLSYSRQDTNLQI